MPKVGWVKLLGCRPLGGDLRSITISRKAGHWFVSVAWQKEVPDPSPTNLPSVGIDRGIKVFAALSDGRRNGARRYTVYTRAVGLQDFVRALYKLAQRGGQLAEVDPAYTSQTCAGCGVIDRASRKDQATFECVACGHTDNADVNAARNILQARTLAVEPPKRTLRRVGKRKQQIGVIHVCV